MLVCVCSVPGVRLLEVVVLWVVRLFRLSFFSRSVNGGHKGLIARCAEGSGDEERSTEESRGRESQMRLSMRCSDLSNVNHPLLLCTHTYLHLHLHIYARTHACARARAHTHTPQMHGTGVDFCRCSTTARSVVPDTTIACAGI